MVKRLAPVFVLRAAEREVIRAAELLITGYFETEFASWTAETRLYEAVLQLREIRAEGV